MKEKKIIQLCVLILVIFGASISYAQSEEELFKLKNDVAKLKLGSSRFLLRGYAHSGIEVLDNENTFVGGSFNPIFLWQQSKKLIFETELEMELEGEETILNLEYANMSYFINDYLTLRLGKFLIPFGTFSERMHPRWINRLPSNPLGYSHE
ncbi:MAG: hypothetical protein KDC90_20430, partial [Ignavibacteriae bacterium]|nr:hypothetical protein [Ignavibacteriota bacterium]